MSINDCLILAAGFGTRMGSIGQILPKVMWPLFERSLLYAQIIYAKELGFKNIFINLHHQADLIRRMIPDVSGVTFLHENQILDSGGAVHNLMKSGLVSGEYLYVTNADLYNFFSANPVYHLQGEVRDYDHMLFGQIVEGSTYNEFVMDDNHRLLKIKPVVKAQSNKYVTYSGSGFINMKKLRYQAGPSKFFETVANPQRSKVFVKVDDDLINWDFGTKELYFTNMFRLLSYCYRNIKSPMLDFLIRNELIDLDQVRSETSYGTEYEGLIKMGACETRVAKKNINAICIGNHIRDIEGNGIYYKDLFDPI